eukprot:4462934-Prorocentrum_lima.AAC.1
MRNCSTPHAEHRYTRAKRQGLNTTHVSTKLWPCIWECERKTNLCQPYGATVRNTSARTTMELMIDGMKWMAMGRSH